MDRPLAYALAERVWQIVSGPLTIWLLIRELSESSTGVYYGVGSVLGIQNLFELGLLNVLIGHAGHASAALQRSKADSDAGSISSARQRMKILIDASGRWFAIAALVFAAASLAIGWYTFTRTEKATTVSSSTEWLGPLLAVVPLSAWIVALSPRLAILEGSGFRELIYKFRFYQRLCGSFVMWTALLCGLGVWSLVLSTLVQLLWTIYIPMFHCRGFFREYQMFDSAEAIESQAEFSWIKDVVPAQWRAALVSMAHHFATQYFVIIVLMFQTRSAAGRLGMTLTVTAAIQAVALAWVQTKFAVISDHHGAGRRDEAGTLWRRTAIVSTSLLVLGLGSLISLIAMLPLVEQAIAWAGLRPLVLVTRFITPLQCFVLSVGCIASHLVGLQGFYVLARKANPLVVPMMIGSLSATAAVWIGGATFGTSGMLIGYAATMALIALPVHTFAYWKFRQR
ncbi:hypothetical protein Pla52n_26480 [Stieleria varia]|uniref:Polysaccharide biosynthesis protein n=2 Tax=Stieleria varia TaxID=2528005 RepID=A0A5C6B009_9BACT|nr:hypothetical protein Pla52n_26480 [Stieleria varia]